MLDLGKNISGRFSDETKQKLILIMYNIKLIYVI